MSESDKQHYRRGHSKPNRNAPYKLPEFRKSITPAPLKVENYAKQLLACEPAANNYDDRKRKFKEEVKNVKSSFDKQDVSNEPKKRQKRNDDSRHDRSSSLSTSIKPENNSYSSKYFKNESMEIDAPVNEKKTNRAFVSNSMPPPDDFKSKQSTSITNTKSKKKFNVPHYQENRIETKQKRNTSSLSNAADATTDVLNNVTFGTATVASATDKIYLYSRHEGSSSSCPKHESEPKIQTNRRLLMSSITAASKEQLVGNTKAINSIVDWLQNPSARITMPILFVTGPAGVGKSTAIKTLLRNCNIIEIDSSTSRNSTQIIESIKPVVFGNVVHKFFGNNKSKGRANVVLFEEFDGIFEYGGTQNFDASTTAATTSFDTTNAATAVNDAAVALAAANYSKQPLTKLLIDMVLKIQQPVQTNNKSKFKHKRQCALIAVSPIICIANEITKSSLVQFKKNPCVKHVQFYRLYNSDMTKFANRLWTSIYELQQQCSLTKLENMAVQSNGDLRRFLNTIDWYLCSREKECSNRTGSSSNIVATSPSLYMNRSSSYMNRSSSYMNRSSSFSIALQDTTSDLFDDTRIIFYETIPFCSNDKSYKLSSIVESSIYFDNIDNLSAMIHHNYPLHLHRRDAHIAFAVVHNIDSYFKIIPLAQYALKCWLVQYNYVPTTTTVANSSSSNSNSLISQSSKLDMIVDDSICWQLHHSIQTDIMLNVDDIVANYIESTLTYYSNLIFAKKSLLDDIRAITKTSNPNLKLDCVNDNLTSSISHSKFSFNNFCCNDEKPNVSEKTENKKYLLTKSETECILQTLTVNRFPRCMATLRHVIHAVFKPNISKLQEKRIDINGLKCNCLNPAHHNHITDHFNETTNSDNNVMLNKEDTATIAFDVKKRNLELYDLRIIEDLRNIACALSQEDIYGGGFNSRLHIISETFSSPTVRVLSTYTKKWGRFSKLFNKSDPSARFEYANLISESKQWFANKTANNESVAYCKIISDDDNHSLRRGISHNDATDNNEKRRSINCHFINDVDMYMQLLSDIFVKRRDQLVNPNSNESEKFKKLVQCYTGLMSYMPKWNNERKYLRKQAQLHFIKNSIGECGDHLSFHNNKTAAASEAYQYDEIEFPKWILNSIISQTGKYLEKTDNE